MSAIFYSHPIGVISYSSEEVKVFDRDDQTWSPISHCKFALWEEDCTTISPETAKKLMTFKPKIERPFPIFEKSLTIYRPPIKAIVPFKPMVIAPAAKAPIQTLIQMLKFIKRVH